jgi:hypothetical protein
MRLLELPDSRNLQVDCSSLSKSKDCGNAPGCQWNGRNGCVAAATLAPTPPPTSNPTNPPSNSPTSYPSPSVSFDLGSIQHVLFSFYELTPFFISTSFYHYDCTAH